LMNPMVPGLQGAKMSSSEEDSKIDLLDPPAALKKKLKKAFCEPGNITDNGILSFCKFVIFPVVLKGIKDFVIERKAEFGGNSNYKTFEELEAAFGKEEVHPGDLKSSVEKYLNELMEPIRKKFQSEELKKLVASAYPAQNTIKMKKASSSADKNSDETDPGRLEIKIGKIVEVSKHPDADSLYVEKIDLGEPSPRTIVSGLVNFVPLEEMQDRMVVVLCNLKPAKLKGIESRGMVLCSSRDDPKEVEPLLPPDGSAPGDKCFIEGYGETTPDEQINTKKKNVWDKVAVDFKTNAEGLAQWQGNNLITSKGTVTVSKVKGAPIK